MSDEHTIPFWEAGHRFPFASHIVGDTLLQLTDNHIALVFRIPLLSTDLNLEANQVQALRDRWNDQSKGLHPAIFLSGLDSGSASNTMKPFVSARMVA